MISGLRTCVNMYFKLLLKGMGCHATEIEMWFKTKES